MFVFYVFVVASYGMHHPIGMGRGYPGYGGVPTAAPAAPGYGAAAPAAAPGYGYGMYSYGMSADVHFSKLPKHIWT